MNWNEASKIKKEVRSIIRSKYSIAMIPVFLAGVLYFFVRKVLLSNFEFSNTMNWVIEFIVGVVKIYLTWSFYKYYMALARHPIEVREAGMLSVIRYAIVDGARLRLKYSIATQVVLWCYMNVLALVLHGVNVLTYSTSNFGNNMPVIDPTLVVAYLISFFGCLIIIPFDYIVPETTSEANKQKPLSFVQCILKSIQVMKRNIWPMLQFMFSFMGWYLMLGVLCYLLFIIYYFFFSLLFAEYLSLLVPITLVMLVIILLYLLPYQIMSWTLWFDQITIDDHEITDSY